ncbi:MAG: signal recognition particle protein, partial [Anaerolineales bacterium]|nr:signal recognition particle protein [Anaerolineales bacterium]
ESALDQEQALAMGQKLISGDFNLDDFSKQLQEIKKMGPISQLLEMIPGLGNLATQAPPEVTDKEMLRIEAIIGSMTGTERERPKIINASRKRRIAQGSGTSVQDVNSLLRQFRQMQRMMKQLTSGRGRGGLSSLLGKL